MSEEDEKIGEEVPQQLGIMIPKDDPVAHRIMGDANSVKGHKYLLGHLPAGEPVIVSTLTGKRFAVPWVLIIRAAIDAGIDEPEIVLPESKIVLP